MLILNIGRTGTGKSYQSRRRWEQTGKPRNLTVLDVAHDTHFAEFEISCDYSQWIKRFRAGVSTRARFMHLEDYFKILSVLSCSRNFSLVIDEMVVFGRAGRINFSLESIIVLHRHARHVIANTQSPSFLSSAMLDCANEINIFQIGGRGLVNLADKLDLSLEQVQKIKALTGHEFITVNH